MKLAEVLRSKIKSEVVRKSQILVYVTEDVLSKPRVTINGIIFKKSLESI